MAVPPKPVKPSFAASFGMPPEPKTEIVKKRRAHGGKLSADLIPLACKVLAEGMPLQYAAEAIGVSRNTFERWIAAGLAGGCTDSLMVEFAEQCYAARALGKESNWRMMKNHAEDDPKSALAVARAADPETWMDRKETKIEVGREPETVVDYDAMSQEDIEELMALEARKKQLVIMKALPA